MQNLRDQIRDRRSGIIDDPIGTELAGILWAMRGLAVAARTAGYNAYGCMCLHLAEQIDDLHGNGRLSRGTLDVLSAWVEHSDGYLRHPSEPVAAMALIAQLNHPQWGSPPCEMEQDILSRALLNPFA